MLSTIGLITTKVTGIPKPGPPRQGGSGPGLDIGQIKVDECVRALNNIIQVLSTQARKNCRETRRDARRDSC